LQFAIPPLAAASAATDVEAVAPAGADAEAEATHKTFCDEEMSKAVTGRDEQQLSMETHEATISQKEAEKQQLMGEIAEISSEISDLTKALNEQTELRENEKAINEKTIADATAGKAAVGQAIQLLKDFYAFVQYKPPKSDRDDATVEDLAPETSWEGEYKGKTDASKGIIGLLETIEADFDRTLSTVCQQETDAETAFGTFKTETETSIGTKDAEKKTKSDEVGVAEGAIVTAKDGLKDAGDLHGSALTELEKLRAMCVEGEESFAERKEAREQEIAALKQALQSLPQ